MDREDMLYQIRTNPRFEQTRVVVLTGYDEISAMVTNLADLLLIRPVEMDLLQILVQRLAQPEFLPKRLTFFDPVTMLYNQDFFYTRLELAFERSKRRPDFLYALLLFEAFRAEREDRPAPVEDEDRVLCEIARRLKQNLRPTDAVARVNGWKFVSLHEDLKKSEDAWIICERVQRLLAQPIEIADRQYKIRFCFAVTSNNPNYSTPGEMYRDAEQRLTQKMLSARTGAVASTV
jgi:diguanylate cyclase (GGDEF)-like protein